MNRLYHLIRSKTLAQKTSWIQSLFTGHKGHLLDIGAGTGAFVHAMQQKSWKVTGLEPDAATRDKAFENYKLNLQSTDNIYNLPEKEYEVITMWHVLEHVENLSEYISNLKKLLSTHGRLIIAAPNFKSDDANYYKEFWAAFDVPRHLWHFSQDSIRQLFLSENMVIEKTIPMKFDSYYVSLLSEKYKKGRMNIVNALYRGFVSNCKAMTSSEYSSLIYVIKKD